MRCPECGVINRPDSLHCPACGYNFLSQRTEAIRPAEGDELAFGNDPFLRGYRSLKTTVSGLLGGLFIAGIGVWLILDPNLSGKAGSWAGVSVTDFLPGIGAVIGGIALIALTVGPFLAHALLRRKLARLNRRPWEQPPGPIGL